MTLTRRTVLTAVVALLASSAPGFAQAVDLGVGWQRIVEPSRVPRADGLYEQAAGATVTWRFEGGADV